MNFKLTTTCLALVALAACDDAIPPTAGQIEYNTARATYSYLRGQPSSDLPPVGGTTYNGAVTANAQIDGKNVYSVLGDLEMRVNFAGAGQNIAGDITNINLIDRSDPAGSQQFTDGTSAMNPGRLNVVGSRVGSAIGATATGQLGAVLGGTGTQTTTQMNMQLEGRVATTTLTSDTLVGTLEGFGTPSNVLGMAVDLPSGQFYARN